MSVVTADMVRQVARLARLRLEGEALTQLAAQPPFVNVPKVLEV